MKSSLQNQYLPWFESRENYSMALKQCFTYQTPVIGTLMEAIVSHVKGPRHFFIIPTNSIAIRNDMRSILSIVYDSDKIEPVPASEICNDLACVAESPEDGLWFRAEVESFQGNIAVVRAVDWGHRECVSIRSLKPIHPAFTCIDALAIRSQLYDFIKKDITLTGDILNAWCDSFLEAAGGQEPVNWLFHDKAGNVDVFDAVGNALFTVGCRQTDPKAKKSCGKVEDQENENVDVDAADVEESTEDLMNVESELLSIKPLQSTNSANHSIYDDFVVAVPSSKLVTAPSDSSTPAQRNFLHSSLSTASSTLDLDPNDFLTGLEEEFVGQYRCSSNADLKDEDVISRTQARFSTSTLTDTDECSMDTTANTMQNEEALLFWKSVPADQRIPQHAPLRDGFEGGVCFAYSCDEVYIQTSYNQLEATRMRNVMRDLYNDEVPNLPVEQIRLGHSCVAKFIEDDHFYRACVEKFDGWSNGRPLSATIKFVDYGNRQESTPVAELKPLVPNLAEISAMACCVRIELDDSVSEKLYTDKGISVWCSELLRICGSDVRIAVSADKPEGTVGILDLETFEDKIRGVNQNVENILTEAPRMDISSAGTRMQRANPAKFINAIDAVLAGAPLPESSEECSSEDELEKKKRKKRENRKKELPLRLRKRLEEEKEALKKKQLQTSYIHRNHVPPKNCLIDMQNELPITDDQKMMDRIRTKFIHGCMKPKLLGKTPVELGCVFSPSEFYLRNKKLDSSYEKMENKLKSNYSADSPGVRADSLKPGNGYVLYLPEIGLSASGCSFYRARMLSPEEVHNPDWLQPDFKKPFSPPQIESLFSHEQADQQQDDPTGQVQLSTSSQSPKQSSNLVAFLLVDYGEKIEMNPDKLDHPDAIKHLLAPVTAPGLVHRCALAHLSRDTFTNEQIDLFLNTATDNDRELMCEFEYQTRMFDKYNAWRVVLYDKASDRNINQEFASRCRELKQSKKQESARHRPARPDRFVGQQLSSLSIDDQDVDPEDYLYPDEEDHGAGAGVGDDVIMFVPGMLNEQDQAAMYDPWNKPTDRVFNSVDDETTGAGDLTATTSDWLEDVDEFVMSSCDHNTKVNDWITGLTQSADMVISSSPSTLIDQLNDEFVGCSQSTPVSRSHDNEQNVVDNRHENNYWSNDILPSAATTASGQPNTLNQFSQFPRPARVPSTTAKNVQVKLVHLIYAKSTAEFFVQTQDMVQMASTVRWRLAQMYGSPPRDAHGRPALNCMKDLGDLEKDAPIAVYRIPAQPSLEKSPNDVCDPSGWCRGRVVGFDFIQLRVKVHFVDFGFEESIELSQIRPLDTSFNFSPIYYRCQLYGFQDSVSVKRFTKMFRNYIKLFSQPPLGVPLFYCYFMNRQRPHSVRLYNTQNNLDVGEALLCAKASMVAPPMPAIQTPARAIDDHKVGSPTLPGTVVSTQPFPLESRSRIGQAVRQTAPQSSLASGASPCAFGYGLQDALHPRPDMFPIPPTLDLGRLSCRFPSPLK